MDTTEVRSEAERHANATVARDFKTAGASLAENAMRQAGDVMKAMPGKLTACDIAAVDNQDDGWVVDIRYTGEDGQVTVRSTWAEIDGAPKITNLEVLQGSGS